MLDSHATVTNVIEVHKSLRRFVLEFDGLEHEPVAGQFVNLGLENAEGAIVKRAYSISSPIVEENSSKLAAWNNTHLEFYVAKVAGGELTPNLFDLKRGDSVLAQSKAVGHYCLPENLGENDTVIFASTGTGIAPHNAMLRHLLASGHKGTIVLLDCCRFNADFAYKEHFSRLQERVIYIPLTTREAAQKMYIQDYIASGELQRTHGVQLLPKHVHVFCCGNPAMIGIPRKNRETGMYNFPETKGLIEILMTNFGLSIFRAKTGGEIHFEKYW